MESIFHNTPLLKEKRKEKKDVQGYPIIIMQHLQPQLLKCTTIVMRLLNL